MVKIMLERVIFSNILQLCRLAYLLDPWVCRGEGIWPGSENPECRCRGGAATASPASGRRPGPPLASTPDKSLLQHVSGSDKQNWKMVERKQTVVFIECYQMRLIIVMQGSPPLVSGHWSSHIRQKILISLYRAKKDDRKHGTMGLDNSLGCFQKCPRSTAERLSAELTYQAWEPYWLTYAERMDAASKLYGLQLKREKYTSTSTRLVI